MENEELVELQGKSLLQIEIAIMYILPAEKVAQIARVLKALSEASYKAGYMEKSKEGG